jgi:4-oxalocrotonate tautomerase
MPVIEVKMYAGRSREDKARLVKRLTEAVVESLGISAGAVTIILHDVSKEDWAKAGEIVADRAKT